MKNLIILSSLTLSSFSIFGQVDEQRAMQEKERLEKLKSESKLEDKMGWVHNAAIGLDLGQLLNLNPYPGSGNSRLGIGGALNYHSKYKKGLFQWRNEVLFNFSAEKTGSGTLQVGSNEGQPFRKALDMLQVNCNIGYKFRESSAWAFAVDLGLRTQLLNSYVDSASQLIYMKELNVAPYKTDLVSKLFSPALITIAPGIEYSKSKDWQIFFSPVGGQITIISDQNIANLGIHGTALKEGSNTEYETSKFALGAMLKAGYKHRYFEKLNVSSELNLFSDYLDNPQNIDVVWQNSLAYELFKGLHLLLKADLYYDDNKTNNISDSNAVGGFNGTGKRINFIEQLLVTYTRRF